MDLHLYAINKTEHNKTQLLIGTASAWAVSVICFKFCGLPLLMDFISWMRMFRIKGLCLRGLDYRI